MALPIEEINAYLDFIYEREELELERECALRGIKYKKKVALKPMEYDQALDDAVSRMIKNGR